MPVLSMRRQVTIPKKLCDRLNLHPGDVLDIFEQDGRITLIKKKKDASAVVLKHLGETHCNSDDEGKEVT